MFSKFLHPKFGKSENFDLVAISRFRYGTFPIHRDDFVKVRECISSSDSNPSSIESAGLIRGIYVVSISSESNILTSSRIPLWNDEGYLQFPTVFILFGNMEKTGRNVRGTDNMIYQPVYDQILTLNSVTNTTELVSSTKQRESLALASRIISTHSVFAERNCLQKPFDTDITLLPFSQFSPINESSLRVFVINYAHILRHDVDDYDGVDVYEDL